MPDAKPSLSDRLKPVLAVALPLLRTLLRTAWVWLRKAAVVIARWSVVLARKTWVVLRRLPISLYSLYRGLADADYARTLTDLYVSGASSLPPPGRPAPAPAAPAAVLQAAAPDAALVLLSLLQKEGRFIDFIEEEITGYTDQEVGAAARVVHAGCRRVLRQHLSIAPVREEAEGSSVTLMKGFDPASVRPTGNVVGEPPFTGSLVHRGWRAVEVRLPQVASSHDVHVLAAAEVEL